MKLIKYYQHVSGDWWVDIANPRSRSVVTAKAVDMSKNPTLLLLLLLLSKYPNMAKFQHHQTQMLLFNCEDQYGS